jgi:ubiquitin C-terminal hydrolase
MKLKYIIHNTNKQTGGANTQYIELLKKHDNTDFRISGFLNFNSDNIQSIEKKPMDVYILKKKNNIEYTGTNTFKISKEEFDNIFSKKPEPIAKQLIPVQGFKYEFTKSVNEATYKCGLVNCNNSCYQNALFQCIFNNTFFKNLFCKKDLIDEINKKMKDEQDLNYKFILYLSNMFRIYWYNSCGGKELELYQENIKGGIRPHFADEKKFHIENYQIYNYEWKPWTGQEDASEFYLYIYNKICQGFGEKKKNPTTVDNNDNLIPYMTYIENNLNYNIIHDNFCFIFKHIKQCTKCLNESIIFESSGLVTLKIKDSANSLENLLSELKEPTTGTVKKICTSCDSDEDHKELLELYMYKNKPPTYLCINPSRFKRDDYGRVTKINKKITMPDCINNIEFKNNNNESKSYIYELESFVYHNGDAGGGHYTAYCKRDDQWLNFDDKTVSLISVQQRKNIQNISYIYFYKLK